MASIRAGPDAARIQIQVPFLSYRSVRRHWMLQLYDILRHLGYSVFLDQMAIPAGGGLVSNLNDGLVASASAVLIWSAEYTDSAWCKKEYEVMETRRTNGTLFMSLPSWTSHPCPRLPLALFASILQINRKAPPVLACLRSCTDCGERRYLTPPFGWPPKWMPLDE